MFCKKATGEDIWVIKMEERITGSDRHGAKGNLVLRNMRKDLADSEEVRGKDKVA